MDLHVIGDLPAALRLRAASPEETNEGQPETLKVVATVFPAYDFARAAAGDKAEVSLLLPPGRRVHSL